MKCILRVGLWKIYSKKHTGREGGISNLERLNESFHASRYQAINPFDIVAKLYAEYLLLKINE